MKRPYYTSYIDKCIHALSAYKTPYEISLILNRYRSFQAGFYVILFRWLQVMASPRMKSLIKDEIFPAAFVDISYSLPLFYQQHIKDVSFSLSFFHEIAHYNIKIDIKDEHTAEQLIVISILYGKYYYHLKTDLLSALKKTDYRINSHNILQLFKELFIKFEIPEFFYSKLTHFSFEEDDVLMKLANGESIRKINPFGLNLSKSEAHIFLTKMPKDIYFEKDVLIKTLILSMLLNKKLRLTPTLIEFIYLNQQFNHEPKEFLKHIDFWFQCLMFYKNLDSSYYYIKPEIFQVYFDFIYSKRSTTYLQDKKLSSNVLLNDFHKYMELIQDVKDPYLLYQNWDGNIIDYAKINFNGDEYWFQQINDGMTLLEESMNMGNCIHTYLNGSLGKKNVMWVVKKKVNDQWISYMNITTYGLYILEKAKKYNKSLSMDDEALVEIWSQQMNLFKDKYGS